MLLATIFARRCYLTHTFSSGSKIKSYGLLGLLVWNSARQVLSYNYTLLCQCVGLATA